MAQMASLSKISTGVPGLDTILDGGIQEGRVYLVEGTPGTGKTTLALRFLLTGLEQGQPGLYITLSETNHELASVAESHGWSLGGLTMFELVSDEGLDPDQDQSVLHPSELELGETTRAVMAQVDASRPARVIFDSLSEMRLLAQNPLRYRRQVLALKQFFTQRRCTVLLLDDRTSDVLDLQLHSIAHGVILLEQVPLEYGAERRRLRVMKLRGTAFRGGWHDYTIQRGGVVVFPRLVAHESPHLTFRDEVVSSGSAELDALLGGGLVRGTNTLLIGASGVGKTTTATAAVLAALRRGEPVAFYLFDETLASLLTRSAKLGMDLRPHIESGLLTTRQINPAEMSPGQFACLVRQAVEHGATIVVIDSLNAYLQSMPGEQFLLLQMHELLSFLNQNGAITLMILGQHGLIGEVRNEVDVSYLADSVVLLRYFEMAGVIRKAISVLKTRTMGHEPTVREFTLGAHGLRVGEPLKGFRGVLSGNPIWTGAESELLALGGPAAD